ncbi:MAG: DEAD/DEAH box helicase [Firmicutes bacterium]|nr:DEAD/DEAH box helicase [Bacillota bacterium]
MNEEAFSEYTYEELDINPILKRGVMSMGFEKLTPIQAQAIPLLLEGKDVIGQAQTGTGKTAAFGLPILEKVDPEFKNVQALILCPTRELAMQAANDLREFSKFMQGIKVLPVYGGQEIDKQIRALKGVQVVVGTPGRVMDHMRRHTIKMKYVNMVVLDEADEMLNMGFREDMEVILGAIDHPHQTCLFSATMPQPILDITHQYQDNPEFIKVTKKELTLDTIEQYYYGVKKEFKYEAIKRLLSHYQYKRCMVFCNTKSMVDELAKKLQKDGFSADGLHGDLNQKQRDFVMNSFRNGMLDIFICTDIAARGIDVDDVEAVINFDVPQELEYYVHRIGRTARAGKEGVSHTLCTSKDFKRLRQIEEHCHTQMMEALIPSFEEINEAQEKATLEKILRAHDEGNTKDYISLIYRFCKTNQISIEQFAAASFKQLLGNEIMGEDIEVNLPEKKKKERKPANNKPPKPSKKLEKKMEKRRRKKK